MPEPTPSDTNEHETRQLRTTSRRTFMKGGALGLGGSALAGLSRGWVQVSEAKPIAPQHTPADAENLAQQANAAGTFVGQVNDGNAFIGLTTDGQRIVAYVCDINPHAQGETYNARLAPTRALTLQGGFWFSGGSPDGQSALLTSPTGYELSIALAPDTAFGAVLDGTDPTDVGAAGYAAGGASGIAGLFRSQVTGQDGAPYVAGWIQLPDGEQRGAITNQQTGAQIPAPLLTAQDIAAGQVTVQGIGTLPLLNCQNGVCS